MKLWNRVLKPIMICSFNRLDPRKKIDWGFHESWYVPLGAHRKRLVEFKETFISADCMAVNKHSLMIIFDRVPCILTLKK